MVFYCNTLVPYEEPRLPVMNLVSTQRVLQLHEPAHFVWIKWHAIEILSLGQLGWKARGLDSTLSCTCLQYGGWICTVL
jgi:hypothetical protein